VRGPRDKNGNARPIFFCLALSLVGLASLEREARATGDEYRGEARGDARGARMPRAAQGGLVAGRRCG
jgi:hypothetical protein